MAVAKAGLVRKASPAKAVAVLVSWPRRLPMMLLLLHLLLSMKLAAVAERQRVGVSMADTGGTTGTSTTSTCAVRYGALVCGCCRYTRWMSIHNL